MSEERTMRLGQVSRKLNVGKDTIISFLAKKGFEIESSPNAKITSEQYNLLAKEFAASLLEKEEAEGLTIGLKQENVVIEKVDDRAKASEDDDQILIKNLQLGKEEEPEPKPKPEPRRRTRGGRNADASKTRPGEGDQAVTELPMANEAAAEAKVAEVPELAAEERRRSRGGRKTSASREASKPSSPAAVAVPAEPAVEPPAEPASKAPSRSRRARKPKVVPDQG